MHKTQSPSAQFIEVQEINSIKPKSKVAFCFNSQSWTLLVSNSGHGTILRGRNKVDFDFGGWCDLKSGRIWKNNGTVSNVPPQWLEAIKGALENHFLLDFDWQ
ncbi:MAG: hypothetical protein HQK84_06050 [Nitrospinae bacterium]|nr:hypothetical protein [Nitrospinota bacterium]